MNAAAGQQLSFATTIDNPDLQPGDSVQIQWGDSTSSAGTMAVASLGNSDGTAGVVTATHTYSTAGIYTIQVTVDGNTSMKRPTSPPRRSPS